MYEIVKFVKLDADTTSRQGCHDPKIVWTGDTIRHVESALEASRPQKVIERAEETGINRMTVFRILKDDLGLVKKSIVFRSEKEKRRDFKGVHSVRQSGTKEVLGIHSDYG